MKTKLITILFSILLISCSIETPCIECEKPFIVNGIFEGYSDKTYVIYTSEIRTGVLIDYLFSLKPQIIAKKGLYNIGDTVKLK